MVGGAALHMLPVVHAVAQRAHVSSNGMHGAFYFWEVLIGRALAETLACPALRLSHTAWHRERS